MRKYPAICGLAVLLLGLGVPSRATVYGASGLILNPSAYVGSNLSVSVGATTFTCFLAMFT